VEETGASWFHSAASGDEGEFEGEEAVKMRRVVDGLWMGE
jgi:hypothetical protein